jgi:two-component system chemotaxis response regulator CheY
MAINILVVDDSAVMRKIIQRTINLCGLDIGDLFEAGNGNEGLAELKKHLIDLLFIDINMPEMNGMEMLAEVRKYNKTKDLPVLIVSTESNKGRIDEIEHQGAAFIHKPFTPEALREKILHVVQKNKI